MRDDIEFGAAGLAALAGQVRKRWLLASAVAGVSLAAMLGGILSLTPTYRADALLLLPAAQVDDPRETSALGPAPSDPFLFQGEMDVLTSPEIARRVVGQLDLVDRPGFVPGPSAVSRLVDAAKGAAGVAAHDAPDSPEVREEKALGTYLKALSAYNSGRSNSAHVSFTWTDPKLAADIVNAHVDAYVDMQSGRRTRARMRVAELLSDELGRRRADVAAATAAVERAVAAGRPETELAPLRSDVDKATESEARTSSRLSDAQQALRDGALQSAAFVASDAKSVSPASVPTSKAFPKTSLFALVALMASIVLGAGAAIVAENLDTAPRKARRRRSFLKGQKLRHLAVVPTRGADVVRGKGPARTVFWEQVRFVRDFLTVKTTANPGAVVLVTSSLPREGKSLVSAALARAFAAAGRRTLVIDADLRRPALTAEFSPDGSTTLPGLGDALDGAGDAGFVLPAGENLWLLPAGSADRRVDALSSPALPALIKDVRSRYDVVILDSPPLAVVSDGLSLAQAADVALLVCDASISSEATSGETLALLRACHVDIAGFVLAGLKASDVDTVSRRDRRRYSRGHEIEAPARPSTAVRRRQGETA